MKRFCAVVAAVLIFAGFNCGRGAFAGLDLPDGAEYAYYYKGGGVESVSYREASRAGLRNGVAGESVRFVSRGAGEAERLLAALGASAVSVRQTDGVKIIYAYCPRFKGSVRLDNERVNLMIADNGGLITAGTPLILCGF